MFHISSYVDCRILGTSGGLNGTLLLLNKVVIGDKGAIFNPKVQYSKRHQEEPNLRIIGTQ